MHPNGFDQFVNVKDEYDDISYMCVKYYYENKFKLYLYYSLVIISLGFIYVIQRWSLSLMIFLKFSPSDYDQATHVLLVNFKNGLQVSQEQLVSITSKNIHNIGPAKVVVYQCLQYYFNPQTRVLALLKNDFAAGDLQLYNGKGIQSQEEYASLAQTFGENVMDIPIKPLMLLLLDEILTPFNIFQLMALTLWSFDQYLMYAMMLGTLTIIEIIVSLRELQQNMAKIRSMILFETEIVVLRFGVQNTVSSKSLVPGDIILIQSHEKLSCDCLLISGQCVMNEAILTGESVPVNKQPGATLFGGTTCLSEFAAQALVTQTAFLTVKGGLARTIMFSKSETFSFQRDSMRYLFILGGIGVLELVISLIVGNQQGFSFMDSLVNGLELITICVPPTLPTALGAGIHLAVERLEKQKILCVKPDKVNVAGKVNLSLFDKTGTLTELGLDVLGCVDKEGKLLKINEANHQLFECLLTCHSLSYIDGKVDGDPMDLAMFNETEWKFTESTRNKELAVIEKGELTPLFIEKRFDFEAQLQRMSVVCKRNNERKVYCKGSPEMISSLCLDDVPQSVYKKYAKEGYRVIACGGKKYNGSNIIREECESGLSFLGFLVFENRIKEETRGAIETLNGAQISCIMVTGDNELTAVNIAQKCGILREGQNLLGSLNGQQKIVWCSDDESILETAEVVHKLGIEQVNLSMTGNVFNELINNCDKEQMNIIMENTYVYARMKPNDKGNLVRALKRSAWNLVSFTGDGTNDTCALRNADVGLALSDEDASLAAPFTSLVFHIEPLITLLKEGRASLVTSIECFKFMTLYSVIQSCAVLMLYFRSSDLTNEQYLYQDLWLILPLAFTMNLAKAYDQLAPYRPISDLLSLPVLSSVIGNLTICVFTQIIAIVYLNHQDFYQPYEELFPDYADEEVLNVGYENTLLIIVSNAQVLGVAVAFTQGPPFREQVWKNTAFVVSIAVGVFAHAIVIIFPELFTFIYLCKVMPMTFRLQLAMYTFIVSLTIITYEKVVTNYLVKLYAKKEISNNFKVK